MAIKQARGVTIGKGTPHRLEGQNGDMTIRSSRKGLKLYVKESNKWHSIDLDINLRQIASTVQSLEKQVKKLSTKTNNTPVVDKILLRQSGGTAAVAIQNKSGAVSFRNSVDGADAPVDIAKSGTVSGGTLTEGMQMVVSSASVSRFQATTNGASLGVSGVGADASAITMRWYEGATHRWSAGLLGDDANTFYIANDADLASAELSLNNNGNLTISGDLTVSGGDATIKAANDAAASLLLQADNSDDAGDDWKIIANADQTLTFGNDIASAGSYVSHLTVTPHATATSTVVSTAGSLKVGSNIIQASDGGSTITMDTSDNVTIGNNLAFNEITAGAVVWQRFQFYIIGGNTARYYYLDHDDRYNSLAHWDNYSTIIGVGTDLTMLDERMAAFPEVAENCIFAGGIGTIYNDTGTDNPKISIFYDSSTLSGDEDQTEAFAPLVDTDVTINTQDRKYGFTLDAVTGTTLNAGCKYVPTVSNIATTVWGSMTLKFITK